MPDDTDSPASKAAKRLSKSGASKGGRARASVLSPEERSEIARLAVRARWTKAGKVYPDPDVESDTAPDPIDPSSEMPYSMYRGFLDVGSVTIEAHVLNDGRRVLTQREVVRLLSPQRDSGTLGRYLERHPLISADDIAQRTIHFAIPGSPNAIGYEATLLVELCEGYLEARAQGLLARSQLKLAMTAEIVIRSVAKVGIIALIDEATGYQEVRRKQDLQLKLQAFIADEMQEWAKMFPDEFWFELARLEGISYSARHRPLRWGKYVMMFVYDAIDEDVGKELRKRNPSPRFLQNHHQWLRKFGRDKVQAQIHANLALMRNCDSMDDFRRMFAKAFSKYDVQQLTFDWGE
ncbi:MAG TPA: P63C domain-containing protein [Candidatus Limnocylindrales bacterium]|jgi:hypothetical protein